MPVALENIAVLPALGGKWLELLKEVAPAISRVAVILMPEHTTSDHLLIANAPRAEDYVAARGHDAFAN
jgi:hypothetical protein